MTKLLILAAALLALLWWKRPRREFVGRWTESEDGVQIEPRPASLLHPTFAGGQDGYDRWIAEWEAWVASCLEHDHADELVQARQLAQRGYRLVLPHDGYDAGLVRLLEAVRAEAASA